jgi:hypothetical protein
MGTSLPPLHSCPICTCVATLMDVPHRGVRLLAPVNNRSGGVRGYELFVRLGLVQTAALSRKGSDGSGCYWVLLVVIRWAWVAQSPSEKLNWMTKCYNYNI